VYEKAVVSSSFGPNNEEVEGEWRRWHNEELRNLDASQNIIIRVIELGRMKWEGYVVCMT
jgi:hypothetical protein